MDAIFRNLQTVENLKSAWGTAGINIKPSLRCQYNKVTGERIPGKYEYLKHEDGTQKFFGVSDDQQHFCAVSRALAKDLEASGAPDPIKVVVAQEVSQDGGETWVLTLMYQGNNQNVTFRF